MAETPISAAEIARRVAARELSPVGVVEAALTLVARDNPGPSAGELRRQFQEIFGMDYSAMEKRLEHYVGSGRYYGRRAPLPKIAPVASYETRPVSAEEARLRMAELAVQVKQSAQGKLVLLDAASKAPTNPRPWEVLGSEALRDGVLELVRSL